MKRLMLSALIASALLWGTSYTSSIDEHRNSTDGMTVSKSVVEGISGPGGIYFPHSTYPGQSPNPVFFQDVTYYRTSSCPCRPGSVWFEEFMDGITVVSGGGTSSYMTIRIPRPASGRTIYYGIEFGDCGCDLACSASAEACP